MKKKKEHERNIVCKYFQGIKTVVEPSEAVHENSGIIRNFSGESSESGAKPLSKPTLKNSEAF